jgi:chloramphenicol-sensitive protein RarD
LSAAASACPYWPLPVCFLSGYTRLLAPLDGTDIFAWRILITLLCVIGLLAWRGELPRLRAAMGELLASPATSRCWC